MAAPLSGIKILDFTWALAGPVWFMQLCDLGAETWKVEVVGTSESTRGLGPIVGGINTYGFSIHRGKDSVLLDLKHPEGSEVALALAEKADVITENFSPGTMAKLALDYDTSRRVTLQSCTRRYPGSVNTDRTPSAAPTTSSCRAYRA